MQDLKCGIERVLEPVHDGGWNGKWELLTSLNIIIRPPL